MTEDLRSVAQRIRELREDNGYTVADVAKATGITEAQYIIFESGESDINASFLFALSKLYGVDMTVLLTGQDAHAKTYFVVRAGKGVTVDRRSDYHYESLSYGFANRKMEPFMVTITPKDQPSNQYTHPGQEFVHVMEGTLEITLGKLERIILREGDSITFEGTLHHGMKALNDRLVRFLSIILE